MQNGQIHSATHSPYKINGNQVRWGEDILGGTFLCHHGQWHADSTCRIVIPEQKDHPILSGVSDIWGNSDVYRTYMEGAGLPEGCTALVMGQPLMGRSHDNAPNPKLEPLLVSWFKHWKTGDGKLARELHSTMGSGLDLQSAGLRRLIINSAYWGVEMESSITPTSSVDMVGTYEPRESGFNFQELGVVPELVSAYK